MGFYFFVLLLVGLDANVSKHLIAHGKEDGRAGPSRTQVGCLYAFELSSAAGTLLRRGSSVMLTGTLLVAK